MGNNFQVRRGGAFPGRTLPTRNSNCVQWFLYAILTAKAGIRKFDMRKAPEILGHKSRAETG